MRRLAVAVQDEDEARKCVGHVASRAELVREMMIVAVYPSPVLAAFAAQTGLVHARALADQAFRDATRAAVTALQMLPVDVQGTYIVCHGWRDPALRTRLLQWRCDELIIARPGTGMRVMFGRLALRGTGVTVRTMELVGSSSIDRELEPALVPDRRPRFRTRLARV